MTPKRQTLTTPPLQYRTIPNIDIWGFKDRSGYTKHIACSRRLDELFPDSNLVEGIRIRLSRRKSKSSLEVIVWIESHYQSTIRLPGGKWVEITNDARTMIVDVFGDDLSGPFYLSVLEAK